MLDAASSLGYAPFAAARAGLTFVAHPGDHADRPIAELWKAITPAAEAVRRWRAQGVGGVCAYNDEVALAAPGTRPHHPS